MEGVRRVWKSTGKRTAEQPTAGQPTTGKNGTNGTFRIGIVSGKLGGVDGVSLEVDKWIDVLVGLGHDVFTIAGVYTQRLDRIPDDHQFELPDIRFDSDFQRQVELQVFPHMSRRPSHPSGQELRQLVEQIETRGRELGERLHEIVKEREIDVLIGQNTNAMPMTILGGCGDVLTFPPSSAWPRFFITTIFGGNAVGFPTAVSRRS